MATRSLIVHEYEKGKYRAIYCHFDGYLKNGVGQCLFDNYSQEDKVIELFKLGDLRSLGPSLDETEAYCRDFGEDWEDTKPFESDSMAELDSYFENSGAQYMYVYTGEQWTWGAKPIDNVTIQREEE